MERSDFETLDKQNEAKDAIAREQARIQRTALYHRRLPRETETDRFKQGLKNAAQSGRMQVVLDIDEPGSGARNDRPGLRQILGAARRGELDIVAVWTLDRFGRSAFDALANIRVLQAAKVRFIAVSQGIDIGTTGDPTSALVLNVLGAAAEFERALLAEQTRQGIEAAIRRGRRIGRPPIEKPAPGEVRRLRSDGLSWRQIAAALQCSSSTARRLFFK